MACRCYCKFLARYPLAVVLMVFLCLCIALTGTFVKTPDSWLSRKDEGFIPIGTTIQSATLAYKQLTNRINVARTLSYKPFPRDVNGDIINNVYDPFKRPANGSLSSLADWISKCRPWLAIGSQRVKIVLSLPTDLDRALNVNFLSSLCQLEDSVVMNYPGINTTCPPLSLGRYIGLLVNKSCHSLRYKDVIIAKKLLFDCSPYYQEGYIVADCFQDPRRCPGVPYVCYHYNAIFNIFTYLVNSGFLEPTPKMQYGELTLIHLPIDKNEMRLASEFVRDIVESGKLTLDDCDVIGVDTGENYAVMMEMAQLDLVQSSMILVIIVIILWFYLSSLLLLATIVLCLTVTVIISFFIYSTVLKISLFAPVNLLSCLVFFVHCIIDILLMTDIWKSIEGRKPNIRLEEKVEHLFDRALFPLFVTHISSSLALFANVLSRVELLGGMAVFSSIGLVLQLCMKLSLIPAVLVLNECGVRSMIVPCCSDKIMNCLSREGDAANTQPSGFTKFRRRLRHNFTQLNKVLLHRMIPTMVLKGRFFWSVTFTSLGIFGIVWTFENTRLRPTVLPTELRLYHAGTLLGNYYDLQTNFPSYIYEQNAGHNRRANPVNMTVNLVFGLIPKLPTKMVTLEHDVTLEQDEEFDFYHPKTVAWLRKYCEDLREQTSMIGDDNLKMPCLLDHFAEVLSRPCKPDTSLNCCNKPVGHFPYNRNVISICLTTMLARNETYDPNGFLGQPIFNTTNHIVAFIYEFTTKYRQTITDMEKNVFLAYANMNNYTLNSSLQGAPTGLDTAWMFSELTYLDITTTIAREMPMGLLVLLGISSSGLFICSFNLFPTFYFAIALTYTSCVVSGSLSFLQWQIGILELVLLAIIVALCSIFPLHYVSAYRHCMSNDRKVKCKIAFEVTASSIFTTNLILLLLASVLYTSRMYPCYVLGQFIFTFTLATWFFTTFFFPSLLSIIGPVERNCCRASNCHCCKTPDGDSPWVENGGIDNQMADGFESSPIRPSVSIIGASSSAPTLCGHVFKKKKKYKKVSLKNSQLDEHLMYQVTSL